MSNTLKMKSTIEIRLAKGGDLPALEMVNEQLFDLPIKRNRAIEFLNDHRHHLALAFDNEDIVGMVSGVHYVHPDKDPSLFINEVGVIESYQNQRIGRRLVKFLCEHTKEMGCTEAWVLTDKSNRAAQKAYEAAGGILEETSTLLFEFKS